MNALHYKAADWIEKGVFDSISSFSDFESRVNGIFEEKDRGDVFEIFVEGYLATQAITQHAKHWVVGGIPVVLRERFNLPNDGTGIDGIYEERDGSQIAYQVKYRKNHNLTFAEVAPFLGITEKFNDRVIFTNASSLSEKAAVRTRWVNGEVFNALTPVQFDQIEAWLKEQSAPVARAIPDPSYQTQALTDIATTLKDNARATVGVSRLVRFGDQYAVLPDELVTTLAARANADGVIEQPERELVAGERVLMLEGALAGYEAIFSATVTKERIALLFEIAGRQLTVETARHTVQRVP
jgi:hypothetical protein